MCLTRVGFDAWILRGKMREWPVDSWIRKACEYKHLSNLDHQIQRKSHNCLNEAVPETTWKIHDLKEIGKVQTADEVVVKYFFSPKLPLFYSWTSLTWMTREETLLFFSDIFTFVSFKCVFLLFRKLWCFSHFSREFL